MNLIKNIVRSLDRRWGLLALLALGAAPAARAQSVDDFQARVFTTADGHQLPYRLFVPANYDPARKYPIVLFLHGMGERGTDNRAQLATTAAPLVFVRPDNQVRWPAFMVAPQCPSDEYWSGLSGGMPDYTPAAPDPTWPLAASLDLLRALGQEFAGIDADRQIITGMSMGGHGTWDAITRYPGLFQKAVPVCGMGDPAKAPAIAGLPLWTFHSADDPQVPVAKTRLMVQALRQAGGTPRYTEYCANGLPCYGHEAWEPAYATPNLLPWLFGPPVVTPPPAALAAEAAPDSVVQGQGTVLSVTNPQSGVAYAWTGPGLQSDTGSSVTAVPPDQGPAVYTVTASNDSSGTNTAQLTVMVIPPAETDADSMVSTGPGVLAGNVGVATSVTVLASVRPLVQLGLRGGSGSANVLYTDAQVGATPAYDGRYDALKRPNASGLGRFSMAASGEALAVDVALYPNPARDQFTVLVPAGPGPVQATLLNALGQTMRRQSAPAGTRFGFDTAGLPPGVYTLRLQLGAATVAKRVVLQ